jgi:hypothetical protein
MQDIADKISGIGAGEIAAGSTAALLAADYMQRASATRRGQALRDHKRRTRALLDQAALVAGVAIAARIAAAAGTAIAVTDEPAETVAVALLAIEAAGVAYGDRTAYRMEVAAAGRAPIREITAIGVRS